MDALAIWCVLASLLVAAELAVGTFHLLMIAVGCAAAAIAAVAGLDVPLQLLAGAAVGIAAMVALRRSRWGVRRSGATGDATTNRDVVLDIGEVVQVDAWVDRTARIRYRGADWNAELQAGAVPVGGAQVIRAVRGSTLVVAPLA